MAKNKYDYRKLLDYKIPNRKKWLLTDSFLQTFKNELDTIFKINLEDNPNYWNTYNYFEGTGGFYKALEITSKKFNVTKAIYEYASKMPWYHSDLFDAELTVMMYKRNIIEEGNVEEIDKKLEDSLAILEAKGQIEWFETVVKHKGYSVITKDYRFVESK